MKTNNYNQIYYFMKYFANYMLKLTAIIPLLYQFQLKY